MNLFKIAIIGGGPGGLATAYMLQRHGIPCDITILEASPRLGGKIRTLQFEAAPVLYEGGAAELYDYSHMGPDPLRAIVDEFGLKTRPMRGTTVVMGDALLKTEADIRAHFGPMTCDALRQFSARARQLISPQQYYESDWQDDNADSLSRQRLTDLLATVPDEAARKYISVAIHSDLATEPHQTSAMYGLENYLMNEPGYMRLYTIDGGIERLTHELISRVKARVRLNHRVVRVERTADEQYRVVACNRGEGVIAQDYDFVVVAVPNNWIPAIEWGGEVLARAMHRHHVHYDYAAHYLRVSLLFQKPFWRDWIAESYFMSDAFGGCCVYDETSRSDGCAFGVMGWLIAGEAAMAMSNLEDAALIERVLESLPAVLQHGRELFLEGRVHRWLGAVSGLPGGFPLQDPDARHLPEPQEHPWLFVVGDYLFDSTINGVIDSADVVAQWIAEEIKESLAGEAPSAPAASAPPPAPAAEVS
jgi:protoporphyrinogen oxidase